MIEIDLACNKRKDLKKQSNDRHVAKWNGVKVPFFLQIFTQVKVKVCCNKTTPKITIYPKSYSSICNGVNVARSYPPLVMMLLPGLSDDDVVWLLGVSDDDVARAQ